MNIHGKKAGYNCDNSLQGIEPYGSSVFVPIEGESQINIVSNKRSSVTHGYAIDPCAAPFGEENDPDAALYQLPYGEHQVYWRILGKPNNGNGQNGNDGSSQVVIYPKLVDLCNFLPTQFADSSIVNSFDPDAQLVLGLEPFVALEKHTGALFTKDESIYFDTDNSGDVNAGDVRLYGPIVGDGTAINPFDPITEPFVKHEDTGLTLGFFDSGETIYFDADGSGTVTDGDTRIANASSQGLSEDEGGDAVNCDEETLVGLGLVTNNGAYKKTEEGLERFDTTESTHKGKGKSKAVEITDLFYWSGVVCDGSLDTNVGSDGVPDGELTLVDDFPLLTEAEIALAGVALDGGAEDGVISDAEFTAYLATLELCTYYTEAWVFYIADIVIYGLDYVNNGSTLTQIRYYPVATTEFTE